LNWEEFLRKVRTRLGGTPPPEEARALLLQKYELFKRLVAANNAALEAMADMQSKAAGDYVFDMKYVRDISEKILSLGETVADSLVELTAGRERRLRDAFVDVRDRTRSALSEGTEPPEGPLVLDLPRVKEAPLEMVGAKTRRLSEILVDTGIPVPDGFAVTSAACRAFLDGNHLIETIRGVLDSIDPSDKAALQAASDEIRAKILAGPWPEEAEAAILSAFDGLEARANRARLLVSVRSSAVGEDGDFSFAGQYASILNVNRERLLEACKEVLASQFSPRAVVYYKARGLESAFLPMAIGVISMIDARASGVMYTRSPQNPREETLTIAGLWGLGPKTVDGELTPDIFTVRRGGGQEMLPSAIAVKDKMLLCREGTGLIEVDVPGWMRDQPCLTRDQVALLTSYGERLEAYYGKPQDIEWAVDSEDNPLILQSRPLRISAESLEERNVVALRQGLEILLRAGVVASRGVAAGPVHLLRPGAPLSKVPPGAILVAPTASPKLAEVIDSVAGIVTEAGSVASHLATVAREFRVPALFDVKEACIRLQEGRVVTLDAEMGNIYGGRVETLLEAAAASREGEDLGTPLFVKLRAAMEHLVPLNLTDPRARKFRPSGCRTLHDILRYAHERSVQEMFLAGSLFGKASKRSLKLEAPIPVDFFLIDLGGGLEIPEGSRTVRPEQFRSLPLAAVWEGIAEVPWNVEAAAGGRGLASVMMTSATSGNLSEQMSEPNYILVTGDYLNMNFRLGFHFSRVDARLTGREEENYASFLFHGGAADAAGRERRIDLLARILENRNWVVTRRGDALFARLDALPSPAMREELRVLGRLLVLTRQIDTLLVDDSVTDRAVEAFLRGDFSLGLREGPVQGDIP